MAVAFDAKPTAWNSADGLNQETNNGTVCSASTGYTVGAGASLLVGVIHYMRNTVADPGAVSAWTWDGGARTGLLGSAVNSRNRSAIAWWTSPTSGSKVLSATVPNASDMYMSAASFTGVDTTTPVVTADNVTGTTGTTVTVTSAASDATVAVWGTNGSTPTVNFNKICAEAPLDPCIGASYQLGGSSNGHTFTGAGGTLQAWAGIHIQAAAGASTTRGTPFGHRGTAFNGGRTFHGIINRMPFVFARNVTGISMGPEGVFVRTAAGLWVPHHVHMAANDSLYRKAA